MRADNEIAKPVHKNNTLEFYYNVSTWICSFVWLAYSLNLVILEYWQAHI